MNILDELEWRGLIKDCTNKEALKEKLMHHMSVYCGFDPTGDSLHVGHLVPLLVLRRFQLYGHTAIALAGGGTGMIGDPRPTTERQLLSADEIAHNVECIKEQLSSFLSFEGDNPALLLNNYDWLKTLTLTDYLRDYGKHFSVSYMLAKDVVASRLQTGISYTEFSYMLLQAIDYLKLYQNYGCTFQIGGSDQWGNVTAGCELIRRVEGKEAGVEAMTLPLIVNSEGQKFGKSEGKAIWLDKNRTSYYAFYQFWVQTQDSELEHYFKVFTFFTQEEIKDILATHQAAPHLRHGQKELAASMTRIVHGEEGLTKALNMTAYLFSGDIASLSLEEVTSCFEGVPSATHEGDLNLVDALVLVGAATSKRAAREFISGGSVLVNGCKVEAVDHMVLQSQAYGNKVSVIRRGKKQYFLLTHE